MDIITIIDTAICSNNIGDEIIMDSVNKFIDSRFGKYFIFRISSHEPLSKRTRNFIERSSFCFVGGTNLLSPTLGTHSQWNLTMRDVNVLKNANTVCVGVGWNDYKNDATWKAKYMLRNIFSNKYIQSVRDNHTKENLAKVGVKSIYTACPTLWRITDEHCKEIPRKKASSAVITLTEWRKDIKNDRLLIDTVVKNYKDVYFFPQMYKDFDYFKSFGVESVKIVDPSLKGYDHVLENEDVDFIGTRLHGGIRAIQKKKRTLIIAIDNRANELGKKTSLPILARDQTDTLEDWIHGENETRITIPKENLSRWQGQFD